MTPSERLDTLCIFRFSLKLSIDQVTCDTETLAIIFNYSLSMDMKCVKFSQSSIVNIPSL